MGLIRKTGSSQKDKTKIQNHNNYAETILPDDLNKLPLASFKGIIHIIDSPEIPEQVISKFRNSKLLGFDTETKPSFTKGKSNKVSLLQLSNGKEAILLRLNKVKMPPFIKEILSNPNIIKVGAAIKDDISGLKKLSPFQEAGFIDLQHIVSDYGIQDKSLKKLSAIILGIRISKSQQTSNWEAESLTTAQQIYAATDAWVSYEIYKHLTNKKKNAKHN